MSYPETSIGGGNLNPCYFYLQEVRHCTENNLYAKTVCNNQIEDFMECHNRAKQVQFYLNRQN